MKTRPSPLEQQRVYGTLRTLLVSYGVIAFGFLSSRQAPTGEPAVPGMSAPEQGLVALGLGAQLLLIAARWLARRYLSDRTAFVNALMPLEIIGDGVTVLLFALATLGPVIHIADNI